MFVEVGAERYSTQFTAVDPPGAIAELLSSGGFRELAAKSSHRDAPVEFSVGDILYIVPMEGLINMHLCQLGRNGKYASVVMARTEAQPHA